MCWDDLELFRRIDDLEQAGNVAPLSSGLNLLRDMGGQGVAWDPEAPAFARELLLASDAGYLTWRENVGQCVHNPSPINEPSYWLQQIWELRLTLAGRDRARGRVIQRPLPDPDEDDDRLVTGMTLEEVARSIADVYTATQLPRYLHDSGVPAEYLGGASEQPKWEYVLSVLERLHDGGSGAAAGPTGSSAGARPQRSTLTSLQPPLDHAQSPSGPCYDLTVAEQPFPHPGAAMMAARKHALDHAAERPDGVHDPLDRSWSVAIPPTASSKPDLLVAELATTVARSLLRHPRGAGAGFALVRGLRGVGDLQRIRGFTKTLFDATWTIYSEKDGSFPPDRPFATEAKVTEDGAIPLHLFGTAWTFKELHSDRDAILFAHVLGPATGYVGGDILIVDALSLLRGTGLTFNEAFQWSDEPGSQKPVLRAHLYDVATRCYGWNLGRLSADSALFVNNTPSAGILHGATPLTIADDRKFQRVIFRCVSFEDEGPPC